MAHREVALPDRRKAETIESRSYEAVGAELTRLLSEVT